MRAGRDCRRRSYRFVVPLLAATGVLAATALGSPPPATGAGAASSAVAAERQSVVVTLRAGGATPEIAAFGRSSGRGSVLDRERAALRAAGIDPDRADLFWIGGVMTLSATPEEIARLEALPEVAAVEDEPQVRIASSPGTLPDPSGGNWGVQAIGADDVWRTTGLTGSGVLVGHIDTGVDVRNPSLRGKVVAWRDFVSGKPSPYDDNGHGTHTASTAAGRAVAGAPIGVAPGANLVVAKAIGASGVAPGSQLLAAAQWIADPDGNPATRDQPSVVNGSWTAGDPNDTWFRSVVRHWRGLGIVPVFATGNTGPAGGSVGSPASYPEVIAVGAADQDGEVADFSSRGPFVWSNADGAGPAAGTRVTKPDLVAPGVDVMAGYLDGFLPYSGSSMASPHVAGVAALMRQAAPGLTPDDVAIALRATARDLGEPGPESRYGAGMVDALAAVRVAGAAPHGFVEARFTKTPPRRTRARRLGFAVALSRASSYRYRVNGGPWSAAISSPRFAVAPGMGRHVVQVQAIGGGGRVDPRPDRHTVIVDRRGPTAGVTWRVRGAQVQLRARVRDLVGVDERKVVWRVGPRTLRGRSVSYRFDRVAPKRVRLILIDRLGNRRVIRRMVTPRRPTVVRARVPRAVRRQGRLRISGAAVRSGRVRVTVRPARAIALSAASPRAVPDVRRHRRVIPGRFSVSVPMAGLAPGLYRVRVEALGRLGRGEMPITRTVRVV
jgi:subtilisin family serine protease